MVKKQHFSAKGVFMNRILSASLCILALNAHADNCPTPIELPSYAHIGEFHQGLAVVLTVDEKYGYINRKGEAVIPVQFPMHTTTERLHADFADGVADIEVIIKF